MASETRRQREVERIRGWLVDDDEADRTRDPNIEQWRKDCRTLLALLDCTKADLAWCIGFIEGQRGELPKFLQHYVEA